MWSVRRRQRLASSRRRAPQQVYQFLVGVIGPVLWPVLQIDVSRAADESKHWQSATVCILHDADRPDTTSRIPERAQDTQIGHIRRLLARYAPQRIGRVNRPPGKVHRALNLLCRALSCCVLLASQFPRRDNLGLVEQDLELSVR